MRFLQLYINRYDKCDLMFVKYTNSSVGVIKKRGILFAPHDMVLELNSEFNPIIQKFRLELIY